MDSFELVAEPISLQPINPFPNQIYWIGTPSSVGFINLNEILRLNELRTVFLEPELVVIFPLKLTGGWLEKALGNRFSNCDSANVCLSYYFCISVVEPDISE